MEFMSATTTAWCRVRISPAKPSCTCPGSPTTRPPVHSVDCRCLALKQTHTRPFNFPFSGTTQVSRYQKGKTNLDFTEARDSEWQWHQLDHMQVCISLQTDNHTSTPPLSCLQAGCPSCRPTNSVKALKAPLFGSETNTNSVS